MTDEAIQAHYGQKSVMATVTKGGETKEYKLKDLAPPEKLEKFVEDVRQGDTNWELIQIIKYIFQ